MNKNLIFALLMIGQILCAFALSMLQPFFPPYALSKDVTEEIIGLIFSANPIGAIVSAICLGKVLTDSNRYSFMCFGLLCQSIGLFLFAGTYYLDREYIIITGIIARFINGFGTSAFMTPLYAYIPMLFPESVEQKISIAEISLALGFLIGPVAGSILFSLGGYTLPFVFFGLFSLSLVPILSFSFKHLSKSVVPIEIDEEAQNQQQSISNNSPIRKSQGKSNHAKPDSLSQALVTSPQISPLKFSRQNSYSHTLDQPQLMKYGSMEKQISNLNQRLSLINEKDFKISLLQKPLTYFDVLSSYAIVMTSMSGFCVAFMFNFMAPINANYLGSAYNIAPDQIGFYLIGVASLYILGAYIAGQIKTNQPYYIFGGGMVLGISSLFVGPDTEIVQIDQNVYFTLAGLSVMGGAAAFMIIFNIPVLNALLNKQFPNQPVQCANMAAALFTCGTYFGELFGPVLAGVLAKNFLYPRAATCMGCTVIFISILYIPVMIQKINTDPLDDLEVGKSVIVDNDKEQILQI